MRSDEFYMHRALDQARLGLAAGEVPVGAVVVREGVEIGWAFTSPPGQNHAEVGALQMAGEASQGSTLYTTLEPCCNYGRTPPCTQAIISSGIKQVHVAAIDPNPQGAHEYIGEAYLETNDLGMAQKHLKKLGYLKEQ